MVKVIYTPGEELPGETTNLGYAFTAGEPVDVTDEKVLKKFRGHPHFTVEGAEKADEKGLHAVHKGRGVYSIMKDGTEVEAGLSKADADAFNALSEADQAEFVGRK